MTDELPFVDRSHNTVNVSAQEAAETMDWFENVNELIQTGEFRTALREYYDDEHAYDFDVEGDTMEPAVFSDPEWNTVVEDVNHVLGTLGPRQDAPQDFEYVRKLINRQAAAVAADDAPTTVSVSDVLYNGNIYSARDIRLEDGLPVFDTYLTDYFSFLSVNHAMASEAYQSLIDGDQTVGGEKRDTYAPNFNAIRRGLSPLPIGVCTATVMARHDGSVDVLFGRRPITMIQAPGVYGTLPGGSIESQHGVVDLEYDIEFTVLREFTEEILNTPVEVDEETTAESLRQMEPIKRLNQYIEEDAAHHIYTSTFVPMEAPRICVGTLFYVSDPDVTESLEDSMEGNWESVDGIEVATLPEDGVPPFLDQDKTASDAVGVFAEGLRVARDEYGVDLGFELETPQT